jgi:flagellar biogenesis protein FliO
VNTTATANASTSTSASPIPYRTTSEVSGGDVAGALAATVALLALALLMGWLARRLGWLQRWGVAPLAAAPGAQRLRIEQSLRVSTRTVVFRISDGSREFLLAESRDGVQWLALPAVAPTAEADHAP